jgi:hypothetical protein
VAFFRTKSKVTPKFKTKYRVENWPAYEASLRKRGDITVWFDEDAINAWNEPPSGLPGGQHRYSDLAIVTALTLRTVFHLALRQTEGFVASLIRLMGLDLMTPDHTTLSRRSGTLDVAPIAKQHDGPIHLVIDSTGLKMVGDGEWLAYKHKTSNTRRSWRKLHLGIDGDGFVVASELTDSSVDDASVGVAMIDQMEAAIARFIARRVRHAGDLRSTRRIGRRRHHDCGTAEEDGGRGCASRRTMVPTQRRHREDHGGRTAPVEEGGRRPPAGSC